jgi:hypothetical protein
MRLPFKKRQLSVAVLVGAVLLVAGAGIAAKGYSLDDVFAELGLMDTKLDSITASQSTAQTELDSLATAEDQIHVQVDVWEDACIGVSVQCTSYHSTDPASSSNHNPVVITVTDTDGKTGFGYGSIEIAS